jgi:DNA-binding transcriptional LysR family regulator
MDLDHLRILVDVFRRGSFAAAARSRDLDPSIVSRTVAALEDELGVRLFQRSTRKLSPTEAGVRYFSRIEPLVEELDRAQFAAADVAETPKGVLRFSLPVSFGELNIIPLLPEFSRRYPDIEFDVLLTDSPLDLLTERLDLAIRLGPLADSGLVAQQLAPMESRVCASPSYLKENGRPEHPSDLRRHNCLLLDMPGFGAIWRLSRNDENIDVRVHGPMRSSNAIALKQCAVAGLGIILQATWIVGRELQQGQLIDLFPHHTVTAASFPKPAMWLVYPSRTYLPEKVKVFLAFLREQFAYGSPWAVTPNPTPQSTQ